MNDEPQEAKPKFYTDYSQAPKPKRIIRISVALLSTLIVILILSVLLYFRGRNFTPYGSRPCWMPCVWTALQTYAREHDGWFPKGGTTPLQSLQLLHRGPLYSDAEKLAGISGPKEEAKKRLESGGDLDESVSSWVYYPGFRNDDSELLRKLVSSNKYDLAVIWEKQPGISIIGTRVRDPESHSVGFVVSGYRQISGREWADFVKQQEEYRRLILDYRKQHWSTNEPAAKPSRERS